jgi:hypothetical protein
MHHRVKYLPPHLVPANSIWWNFIYYRFLSHLRCAAKKEEAERKGTQRGKEGEEERQRRQKGTAGEAEREELASREEQSEAT